MSKQCKISRAFNLSFTPDRCFNLDFSPSRCFDLCLPESEIDSSTCDIKFVDYQVEDECALTIDSVGVSGTTATITASGGVGTVYYRFLDENDDVLQDWSNDNTYDSFSGYVVAQVADTFGCVDTEIVELLEAPANTSSTVTGEDVDFSWDAVDSASGYNVYVDSGSGFAKHNGSLIETNSYGIDGLATGEYDWYVVAVDDEGSEGVQSATKEFLINIWYTDFSEYTTDQAPSDWTKRFEDGGDWLVRSQAGVEGGTLLSFENGVSGRKGFSWDVLDSISANLKFEFKFRGSVFGGSNAESDPRIMSRASGGASIENTYAHGERFGSSLRLQRYLSGSSSIFEAGSSVVSLDTWYVGIVEVNGSSHSATIFEEDGETQLGTVSGSNSDITDPGWNGLFSFGSGDYEIDWIKVTKLD